MEANLIHNRIFKSVCAFLLRKYLGAQHPGARYCFRCNNYNYNYIYILYIYIIYIIIILNKRSRYLEYSLYPLDFNSDEGKLFINFESLNEAKNRYNYMSVVLMWCEDTMIKCHRIVCVTIN